MKQVETGGTSINGVAMVEPHPTNTKVRVTFAPKTEGEKPAVYILEKEDCPDYIRKGKFMVNLSSNGKKMYGIHPITGIAKFKVKEFVAGRDQKGNPLEPAPKTHPGTQYGPYQTFSVIFEISEGENKGMQMIGSFPFEFIEDHEEVDGKIQSVLGAKRKKNSPRNDLFWDLMKVTGIDRKTLPYKENPLPMLQKHMLKEDRTFTGAYKDGWINSLFSED
jgi:hypothetical protein